MGTKRKTDSSPSPSTPPHKEQKKTKTPKTKESDEKIHNQEQSPLLCLPPEIRNIIYRHILVSPVLIHIDHTGMEKHTFRSFPCQAPEEERLENRPRELRCPRCRISHGLCPPKPPRGNRYRYAEEKLKQRSVMAFLQSCKRVYNEGIDILYHENRFYIDRPTTLIALEKRMPVNRLSAFRSVYLEASWLDARTSPFCGNAWMDALQALERLDGLRCLVLVLRPRGWASGLDELVGPVEEAGPRLKVCHVVVNPVWDEALDELCLKHREGS